MTPPPLDDLLDRLYVVALPMRVRFRGIMVREGVIYVNPSTDSAKLSNITRGREVAILEHTPGWVRGAIASNAIVRACLERSGVDHYYASDTNIADGIISGVAARAA